jgi:ABC-type antimicrobial peptide transport system permease subunit
MFESLHLMARLKPGVTMAQASANANVLFQQILRGFSDAPLTRENLQELDKTRVELNSMATGFSQLRWQFSEPLKVLMAVVGLVLLIACANIANLLLARSTARARELAVRQALGAARSRLIRQLLTESLVLALAGGALGVAFASGASHLLVRMVANGHEAVQVNVPVDMRLLLFTLGVTLATALLFGTIPAFRATRLNLTDSLKDGRSQAGTQANGPLARALVISQVAVSLVLLTAAGLFVRSLVNITNVDTGFDREDVIHLRVDPSSAGYLTDARLAGLYRAVSAIRQTIHNVDRSLPISDVTTLDEQVGRSITNQRLVAQLSTFFGLLAVFLSCVGIYGLMSYVVTRRTNEIGLRMALGAERSHVLWLVMRESLWLVGLGVAIGVPAALAGDRLVSSMLYGLQASDPMSLLAGIGVLLAVAALAGYLPARRAAMVDPMVSLRHE